MNIGSVFVIGLMSGTSLDGIDLVYVKFDKNRYQDFDILHSETVAYSEKWKSTLQNAIAFSSDALKSLDIAYGKLLGEVLNGFIDKFNIDNIDFIASHGHTVLHQPQDGVTLQVGDGQTIANATNLKVICDFRTQDVQLGGQGAPLVPIGDELLFSDYGFCLNLGGFSNISFHKKGSRIAYDICPVNIVLNFYANKLGVDYDESGKIASKGKINKELLEKLNALSFYTKAPPKSLGLEWVQEVVFPLIDQLETNVSSILRTFVEHIAMQIGSVIAGSNSVLITGGGVFNSFLLERIAFYAHIKITLTSSKIIDFKEALIFAFLGLLRSDGKVNCLKSVTGASKNHSSGEIFYPNRK
ncbi:anhydro-N-acetylmuramic acid kinase [Polaribacter butkevichii]|uniref:Anhydro-N-acetylmuramic acid kinase n=1 Tax=Polaribacter butkevichii TaxID=218490 RepID=A0A2P6C8V3_9FLAO|nr:anhydro-N-acetylmuramic acid kinase [Polaribacter butkevichii]PQJ69347.1 anhydro-N-acetylmuramic acid kinase [Polaribacter butkevichii]